ncbi:hypothetical protein EGT74_06710 [Chitinophaga lutea]|uniref:DUF2846 domain-containing protein n=1 Tax=Chitinophaga lutea TaxID=2488634 RepID=A0A3N4Q0T8_9BACT|nr:DUF2846 domain-containing protein [Chitinophaga lutea]RPE13215.1 hypothetical protein EGT74_06710 [Chitinophaga lutea]
MKHFLFSLLATLLLSGAAAAQALPDSTMVVILQENEPLIGKAKPLGEIKIADGGFKVNCGYERTMEEARQKARAQGANVIKITSLKPPDAWSTCYRLKGDIFYFEDVTGLVSQKREAAESEIKALMPDSASYALLCVYRPKSGIAWTLEYNLHVNDSTVCRVKNGEKYLIKMYNTGQTKIWARTESKMEVTANVQPGRIYFVRCSAVMGAFVGRPKLKLVDEQTGMQEFGAMAR